MCVPLQPYFPSELAHTASQVWTVNITYVIPNTVSYTARETLTLCYPPFRVFSQSIDVPFMCLALLSLPSLAADQQPRRLIDGEVTSSTYPDIITHTHTLEWPANTTFLAYPEGSYSAGSSTVLDGRLLIVLAVASGLIMLA